MYLKAASLLSPLSSLLSSLLRHDRISPLSHCHSYAAILTQVAVLFSIHPYILKPFSNNNLFNIHTK
jgi:hypothetical protein